MIFGDQQKPLFIRAHPLHRRHRRLNTKRHEFGIQIVEAAREQIGVDGCQLETGIAQIHRGIERRALGHPFGAEPALNAGTRIENFLFQIQKRPGERGGEMWDHGE